MIKGSVSGFSCLMMKYRLMTTINLKLGQHQFRVRFIRVLPIIQEIRQKHRFIVRNTCTMHMISFAASLQPSSP